MHDVLELVMINFYSECPVHSLADCNFKLVLTCCLKHIPNGICDGVVVPDYELKKMRESRTGAIFTWTNFYTKLFTARSAHHLDMVAQLHLLLLHIPPDGFQTSSRILLADDR